MREGAFHHEVAATGGYSGAVTEVLSVGDWFALKRSRDVPDVVTFDFGSAIAADVLNDDIGRLAQILFLEQFHYDEGQSCRLVDAGVEHFNDVDVVAVGRCRNFGFDLK